MCVCVCAPACVCVSVGTQSCSYYKYTLLEYTSISTYTSRRRRHSEEDVVEERWDNEPSMPQPPSAFSYRNLQPIIIQTDRSLYSVTKDPSSTYDCMIWVQTEKRFFLLHLLFSVSSPAGAKCSTIEQTDTADGQSEGKREAKMLKS